MDITHVEVLHDHVVHLRFADGVEKSIDLEPYLHGRVFAEIRNDPAAFAAVQVDADARFRIDRDLEGQPIEAGSFELTASLFAVGATSLRFEAANGDEIDLSDIAVTRQVFSLSHLTSCDIPAEGGRCEYSFDVHNNSTTAQSGTAFSIVRIATNGLVSFEASTRPGLDPVRAPLEIPAGEFRRVTFGFDVPAFVPDATEICVLNFVGAGPAPAFQVKGFLPISLCMRKGGDGFPVLGAEESRRVLEKMGAIRHE